LHLPDEYGGVGASYLEGCLIGEELAWGCAAIATTLGANELASAPVRLGGSDEIKKRTFGTLIEEPKLASFCLTEPDAGSDVSGMRTTAIKRGDRYIINGSKCFITNRGYADWYTVYAKTDKDAGHRGISRDWPRSPGASTSRRQPRSRVGGPQAHLGSPARELPDLHRDSGLDVRRPGPPDGDFDLRIDERATISFIETEVGRCATRPNNGHRRQA
jgi:acyl-CoA dehydrogenase